LLLIIIYAEAMEVALTPYLLNLPILRIQVSRKVFKI